MTQFILIYIHGKTLCSSGGQVIVNFIYICRTSCHYHCPALADLTEALDRDETEEEDDHDEAVSWSEAVHVQAELQSQQCCWSRLIPMIQLTHRNGLCLIHWILNIHIRPAVQDESTFFIVLQGVSNSKIWGQVVGAVG